MINPNPNPKFRSLMAEVRHAVSCQAMCSFSFDIETYNDIL
jgi:hypothetical protein